MVIVLFAQRFRRVAHVVDEFGLPASVGVIAAISLKQVRFLVDPSNGVGKVKGTVVPTVCRNPMLLLGQIEDDPVYGRHEAAA